MAHDCGDAHRAKPYGEPASAGGERLNELEIEATLIHELGLRPWEIDLLDDWTIRYKYFHPLDKDGNVKVSSKDQSEPETYKEVCWAAWRALGWEDWFIEAQWRLTAK